MKTCDLCKIQYDSRNKKFCSKLCLVRSNGKKVGGHNKNKQKLFCNRCGNEYEVNLSRVKSSKYCSKTCHNRSNSDKIDRKGKNNPAWKGGIQTYRKKAWSIFERKCSLCNSTEKLDIHHINGNRYDNRIENLKPLCRKCHQQLDGRSKRDSKGKIISNHVSSHS